MPRISCRPAFVPPDLTIGSLFAGIGGIELGLEWSGVGRTIWQVEKDAFCRQVLAKWWPNVSRFEDIKTVGAGVLPYADLICGGFPCVDISYAGKGAGLAGERSGLWFEYERIIREMGPRFVVVENVAALRSRGLDVVLGAMASLGYDAEWRSVRASDVGAPHKRERVFIVAHAVGGALQRWRERRVVGGEARACEGDGSQRQRDGNAVRDRGQEVADPDVSRRDRRAESDGESESRRKEGEHRRHVDRQDLVERMLGHVVEPSMGRESHGIPDRLDRWPARPGEAQHEWEPPRAVERGLRGSSRVPRLRALGNAVVPQVVAEFVAPIIFRVLREQG